MERTPLSKSTSFNCKFKASETLNPQQYKTLNKIGRVRYVILKRVL